MKIYKIDYIKYYVTSLGFTSLKFYCHVHFNGDLYLRYKGNARKKAASYDNSFRIL